MKKQSLSQNKLPARVLAEIADLEKRARQSEENGNPNTIWHERLAQLKALQPEVEPAANDTGAESDNKETD